MKAYLFPGQGAQHVGMGKILSESEPAARAVFDLADEIVGFSLSRICFEGSESELHDTRVQQPAIFVTSAAHLAVAREQGLGDADLMAGHSLGEISALCAANAIEFEAGLNLVQKRGTVMAEAGRNNPGAMSAILGLSAMEVGEICAESTSWTGVTVQVANDNCPGQTVISGHLTAIEFAEDTALERGARKVVRLPISIAAHSELMNDAANAFEEAVASTAMREPQRTVIGNVQASPLLSVEEIRLDLVAQLTSTVRWTESIQRMVAFGALSFYDVGPGQVLMRMMKRIDRSVERFALVDGLTA